MVMQAGFPSATIFRARAASSESSRSAASACISAEPTQAISGSSMRKSEPWPWPPAPPA